MHRSTILSLPAGRLARAVLAVAGLALAAAAVAPAAASAAPTPKLSWAQVNGTLITSADFSCFGCAGEAIVYSVVNTGQSATAALTITVTGSPAFSKGNLDECTGTSLSPGASCFVSIDFFPAAPIMIGHQYKGIATASLHGSDDGATLTLTGTVSPGGP